MFFSKILIAITVIACLKLNCSEAELAAFDNTSRRSVACQTTLEDIAQKPKSTALFLHGNFNPDYKFSKSEIARLALLQLIITIDSVVSILGSIAYNTGVFALNLATLPWKNG